MHEPTVLNVEAFDKATRADLGLTSEVAIAKRLGVAPSTVNRARKGRAVGHKFIAACTAQLPARYEDLFRRQAVA